MRGRGGKPLRSPPVVTQKRLYRYRSSHKQMDDPVQQIWKKAGKVVRLSVFLRLRGVRYRSSVVWRRRTGSEWTRNRGQSQTDTVVSRRFFASSGGTV